jgi:hypothetical protein
VRTLPPLVLVVLVLRTAVSVTEKTIFNNNSAQHKENSFYLASYLFEAVNFGYNCVGEEPW